MKKKSLLDQRLDRLLPLAIAEMRKEPCRPHTLTPDDLLRADQKFQAAMQTYFQPAGQKAGSRDAAAQRRENA